MKKIIILSILVSLFVCGAVFAREVPDYMWKMDRVGKVYKFQDGNTICYVADSVYLSAHSLGISCVRVK